MVSFSQRFEPADGVEPRRERVSDLQTRHALRPSEALQLGRGRGHVQRSIVPLVSKRRVESPDREGQAVPDGRGGRDIEAMQADFRRDRFRAELLDAGARAGTAEVRIESVAVPVASAFHLDARARGEPRRERLEGTDAELVEAEVGMPWL